MTTKNFKKVSIHLSSDDLFWLNDIANKYIADISRSTLIRTGISILKGLNKSELDSILLSNDKISALKSILTQN